MNKYNLNDLFENVPKFDAPIMNFSSGKKVLGKSNKNLRGLVTAKAMIDFRQNNNQKVKNYCNSVDTTDYDVNVSNYQYKIGKKFPMQYQKFNLEQYNDMRKERAAFEQNVKKVRIVEEKMRRVNFKS